MVVVVDGVMPIQGDGKAVHKAKDHSRATFSRGTIFDGELGISSGLGELVRDGEPDALKDARPVRERLHRDRLFVRTGMAR